jgi:hypothetical protein
VLDAVAGEAAHRAVVEARRDADHDRPFGHEQALGDGVADARRGERPLELRLGGAKERRVPLERLLLRGCLDSDHGRRSLGSAGLDRPRESLAHAGDARRERLANDR